MGGGGGGGRWRGRVSVVWGGGRGGRYRALSNWVSAAMLGFRGIGVLRYERVEVRGNRSGIL